MLKKLLTTAAAIAPFALFAHPGHGPFHPSSLLHYFGTPEHALPTAALVLLAAGLWAARRRKAVS